MFNVYTPSGNVKNYMGRLQHEQLLNDVDENGPCFIKSKGGTIYMVTKCTSDGYNFIKVTNEGLFPWSTAKNRTRTLSDLANASYFRIDGDIEIHLSCELKEK